MLYLYKRVKSEHLLKFKQLSQTWNSQASHTRDEGWGENE